MIANSATKRELGPPYRVVKSKVMVAADLLGNQRADSFLQKISRRICGLQTAHARKPAERRNPSVLLVEDDPCNRELIEDIFRYDGIPASLVTASSAEESLTMVKDMQPVLILMDLKLPGMDGIEATRILKADRSTEHIPVWAVTCLNHRTDIERGLDAGCDGYVTKPIRRSEFVFRLLSLWDAPARSNDDGLEPDDLLGSDYWLS